MRYFPLPHPIREACVETSEPLLWSVERLGVALLRAITTSRMVMQFS